MFRQIMQRVDEIQLLQQIFSTIIPTELAKHCRVINIQGDSLVVGAEHAQWATRIRYSTPELLKQLSEHKQVPRINAIRVVVSPPSSITTTKQVQRATLTEHQAQQILNMSENIDDEDIANCLRRISRNR